jgi:AcrR family transcriptional regulator
VSVYGGVSAEARRAGRRAQLIGAGLDLLGGEGWQATTVRAVCARAKLTPRYFYESFADLDALLEAVFDEIAGEAAAAVLERVLAAEHDANAKARAAIGAFVSFVADDPRKARVLFVEALGSEVLVRKRFGLLRMFASIIEAQGRAFYGIPEGHRALVQTTALTVAGGLAETLLAWLDGTLEVDQAQLVEDCAELFVATGEAAVRLAQARSGMLRPGCPD